MTSRRRSFRPPTRPALPVQAPAAPLLEGNHGWQECRPALSSLRPEPYINRATISAILDALWTELPIADRMRFHAFFCWRVSTKENVAALGRITAKLTEAGLLRE